MPIPAQSYEKVKPYITKDGSTIRELMHPGVHGNHKQSLAEARIPAGKRTLLHRHQLAEELYHVTLGSGLLRINDETFPVQRGDTICIPPGAAHCITALESELVLLCCCAPAYAHTDTELLETALE